MYKTCLAGLAALLVAACSSTTGDEVDEEQLGYSACDKYFGCGTGRYCNVDGFCSSDCRSTADCSLLDKGELCNLFGECVEQGGIEECNSHADCGENIYCSGPCDSSVCGDDSDCPCILGSCKACQGTCAPQCASDNDCLAFNDPEDDLQLQCTPFGQCLLPGWEQWITLDELPPTTCMQDSHCFSEGWNYECPCEKSPDPKTGIPRCRDGVERSCVQREEPLDFGDGPFAGVWGLRMEIGVVTFGLPLVPKQNTYSSNLLLIKVSHTRGDALVLEEKPCDFQLINFRDDDREFADLAWMVIPLGYLKSLPVLVRTVELDPADTGKFESSMSLEVRGCILDDPVNDPLPTRDDYEADPNDPRFWDQDEDGQVGMTTLMDGIMRGAIYNVQRWTAIYHGRILDADHVKGLSTIVSKQKVLSASNPALIQDIDTFIHDDEDRTYFRMQRLNDGASCADLIRLANRDDSWLRHTPHMDDVPDP